MGGNLQNPVDDKSSVWFIAQNAVVCPDISCFSRKLQVSWWLLGPFTLYKHGLLFFHIALNLKLIIKCLCWRKRANTYIFLLHFASELLSCWSTSSLPTRHTAARFPSHKEISRSLWMNKWFPLSVMSFPSANKALCVHLWRTRLCDEMSNLVT